MNGHRLSHLSDRLRRVPVLVATAVIALSVSNGVRAQGDVARGEQVFKQCRVCHVFDPSKKRQGPHLKGIVGRKAASVEGFRYSKALLGADLTWDDKTLKAYILAPRKAVPGTSMLVRLRKRNDVDHLIAFLKTK